MTHKTLAYRFPPARLGRQTVLSPGDLIDYSRRMPRTPLRRGIAAVYRDAFGADGTN